MKRSILILSLIVFFVIIGSVPINPAGQEFQNGQEKIVLK